MSEPHDNPSVLFSKANEDARMAAKFARDADVSDEYIGFFCQQAVEKALKAVLSARQIIYRKTHNLEELLDQLAAHHIAVPVELDRCIILTPFAASLRYDYLPPEQDDSPFDRIEAVQLAELAVKWASEFVGDSENAKD